jgi:hypothetical protein
MQEFIKLSSDLGPDENSSLLYPINIAWLCFVLLHPLHNFTHIAHLLFDLFDTHSSAVL